MGPRETLREHVPMDSGDRPRVLDLEAQRPAGTVPGTDTPPQEAERKAGGLVETSITDMPTDPHRPQAPGSLRPCEPAGDLDIQEEEDNVWDDGLSTTAQVTSHGQATRVISMLVPGALHQESEAEKELWTRSQADRIPTVLQPAPGLLRPETNPFKRKPVAGPRTGGHLDQTDMLSTPANSVDLSCHPLPVQTHTTTSSSWSTTSEPSKNPWQPVLDEKKQGLAAPQAGVTNASTPDSGQNIWDSMNTSRRPSSGPGSSSPALLSLPSEGGSTVWDEEVTKSIAPPLEPLEPHEDHVFEDSRAWDDQGSLGKENTRMLAHPMPNVGSAGSGDEWNLVNIDDSQGPPSRRSTWENVANAEEIPPHRLEEGQYRGQVRAGYEDQPPSLPPRRSQDHPPPQPPRPVSKSETYQIKNICWHDARAAKNPRTSPILVQNANGPCPLVALVNALTLTTPADVAGTALVETLRSREQVSLGLLLDAVFDELIRRNDPDVALPDVTELYGFLKGLHTGMNVNPRFIPTDELITSLKRTSLSHIHPTERGDIIPGTFEVTKEMALYSTFSIPLYHGWLPAPNEAAYNSFFRQAASYEDAQNLLFREEELEGKLSSSSHQGLSEEEQKVYQDILTIKSFLSISATQLTPSGLKVVTQAMEPGSVSILFRNDHFSTLYRHPQTLQLLGLVTDAGYATHEEVVWESLVDVNGEHAEFFSGDFRLVGGVNHGVTNPTEQHAACTDDWNVQAANGRVSADGNGQSISQIIPGGERDSADVDEDVPPMSPSTEQEDRDLALALQLQEEEDERHRAEQERRSRESRLSEQFIEQQARSLPPSSRGRGGIRGSSSVVGRESSNTNPTPVVTGRRSSGAVNVPVTMNSSSNARGRGSIRGNAAPARGTASVGRGPSRAGGVQGVRSLLPPRSQAVSRPADDGLDDAPPSYEQAARQDPYVPPEGHPSHPTSSPDRQSSTSGQRRQTPPPPPISTAPIGRRVGHTAGYPGVSTPTRMRPSVSHTAIAGTAGSGRDRDCTIM